MRIWLRGEGVVAKCDLGMACLGENEGERRDVRGDKMEEKGMSFRGKQRGRKHHAMKVRVI